jgi:rhodanese-related sulfurtransferase
MNTFFTVNALSFAEGLKTNPNAVLIDVRTQEEYEMGHMSGSLLMDVYDFDFANNAELMDKTKDYFVYCQNGGRSLSVCIYFQNNGFTGKIYNLEGGLNDYDGNLEM